MSCPECAGYAITGSCPMCDSGIPDEGDERLDWLEYSSEPGDSARYIIEKYGVKNLKAVELLEYTSEYPELIEEYGLDMDSINTAAQIKSKVIRKDGNSYVEQGWFLTSEEE